MTQITTSDVELIGAYGGMHWTIDFESAVDVCNWFTENDVNHGRVGLARIADDAFELVAFGEHAEWGRIGVDSEYVSLTVGRELARTGHVDVMALYGDPADEPKTDEQFAANIRKQLWSPTRP